MALTVDLDLPAAQVMADQAAIIADLQFVMETCKRLLSEFALPEAERDPVVPVALWSAALVAYGRCFSGSQRFGLSTEDIERLPLQGDVVSFHNWVLDERNKHTKHPGNPFDAARVGAALADPDSGQRRVEGLAILSMSRVLVDDTGVRQLGGLASELAKQTAEQAKAQQDIVLTEAQKLDLDQLYARPELRTGAPSDEEAEG